MSFKGVQSATRSNVRRRVAAVVENVCHANSSLVLGTDSNGASDD